MQNISLLFQEKVDYYLLDEVLQYYILYNSGNNLS